jgi:hypothetical protein
MNPQNRTCCFPLREDVALEEPRRGSDLKSLIYGVLVRRGVWRRKPVSDLLLQLVTCRTLSALEGNKGRDKGYERLILFTCLAAPCIETFTAQSAGD